MENFLVADLGFFQTLPGILLVIGCVIAIIAIIILLIPKKDKKAEIIPDKIEKEGEEIIVDNKTPKINGEVLEGTTAINTIVDDQTMNVKDKQEINLNPPVAEPKEIIEPQPTVEPMIKAKVEDTEEFMPINNLNQVQEKPIVEPQPKIQPNIQPQVEIKPQIIPDFKEGIPMAPMTNEVPKESFEVPNVLNLDETAAAIENNEIEKPQVAEETTMYGGFSPKPNPDIFKQNFERKSYGGFSPKPTPEVMEPKEVSTVVEPVQIEPTQSVKIKPELPQPVQVEPTMPVDVEPIKMPEPVIPEQKPEAVTPQIEVLE